MDGIADITFHGDSIEFPNFGRVVASAGDVNGDQIQDILIGGKAGYPKRAELLITRLSGDEVAFDTLDLFGEDILPSTFGLALCTAGDVNKDGFDDILVSDYQDGVELKGKAYVFHGGECMNSAWDITLIGDGRLGKQFGLGVAFAGDVNGDDHDEMLVTSYGDSGYAGKIFIYTSGPTSIDDPPTGEKLNDFQLNQNYPNPFNPETVIEYVLPENSKVDLSVYNILGEHVRTLINQYQKAGYRKTTWDGKDQAGRRVSSGIYLYRLKTDSFIEVKKMLLLR
jgi:hypothetical protein